MVALALLSFGLYGAADLIASARKTSNLTEVRAQAASLAQLKLEELRASGNNLKALCAAGSQIDLPVSGTQIFEQNVKYAWKAHIIRNSGPSGRIDLAVQVTRAGEAATGSPLSASQGIVYLPETASPAGDI